MDMSLLELTQKQRNMLSPKRYLNTLSLLFPKFEIELLNQTHEGLDNANGTSEREYILDAWTDKHNKSKSTWFKKYKH